jgi:hypothetical protein
LFDENGDESGHAKDDLAKGLHAIIQKHQARLEKKLEKYVNLSQSEVGDVEKLEKA